MYLNSGTGGLTDYKSQEGSVGPMLGRVTHVLRSKSNV